METLNINEGDIVNICRYNKSPAVVVSVFDSNYYSEQKCIQVRWINKNLNYPVIFYFKDVSFLYKKDEGKRCRKC